ncbi:MAG: hypothetical protein DHS20C14_14480 [Phycisphaeraceae bacterium]|nr:MAG: hypothetical protein DHS20C14_14480 [Phycisphaeraceae bacterium]
MTDSKSTPTYTVTRMPELKAFSTIEEACEYGARAVISGVPRMFYGQQVERVRWEINKIQIGFPTGTMELAATDLRLRASTVDTHDLSNPSFDLSFNNAGTSTSKHRELASKLIGSVFKNTEGDEVSLFTYFDNFIVHCAPLQIELDKADCLYWTLSD